MKIAGALICLLVIMVIAVVAKRGVKMPPETIVIGARKGSHPWVKFRGSLLDARVECYDFAALETDDIVDVNTGYKTGRKIVKMNVNQK